MRSSGIYNVSVTERTVSRTAAEKERGSHFKLAMFSRGEKRNLTLVDRGEWAYA